MVYVRFLISLAFGLAGVCMVLTILMDTLLADWDIYSDLRLLLEAPSLWRRSLRMEEDDHRLTGLVTRLQKYETRSI